MHLKELRNFQIIDFFVIEDDVINIGDKLFTYKFLGDDKLHKYFSDKEGAVKEIYNISWDNKKKKFM